MTPQMLMGQTQTHLVQVSESHWLHKKTLQPFLALQAQAKNAGFNLQLVSSFRSFEQQLAIWNNKLNGLRPVLDSQSRELDIHLLSAQEKIKAILRWSALPGASRHHWGSDIDIYDPDLQTKDRPLQLIPQEYLNNGPQAPLTEWLNANINKLGFFRPYQSDLGGVNPEPWHLSHASVSIPALLAFSCQQLAAALAQSEIAEKESVIELLPWIESTVIRNIDKL